jgi:hypothetical protein
MTPVLILSLAICVTMFALGFSLLLPISSAFSAFADLVGVAARMVVLGLFFGQRLSSPVPKRPHRPELVNPLKFQTETLLVDGSATSSMALSEPTLAPARRIPTRRQTGMYRC